MIWDANAGLPGSVGEYGPPGMQRLLPAINPNKVLATFWLDSPPYILGRDPVDEQPGRRDSIPRKILMIGSGPRTGKFPLGEDGARREHRNQQ